MRRCLILGLVLCCVLITSPAANAAATATWVEPIRKVLSLDGQWQIAEGAMDKSPSEFNHAVAVPGLVDMAQPPFAEVGKKSGLREAFWYRHKFQVEGAVPPVAMLKISKAMFGTKVILNGKDLGEHPPSFTPGWFDVAKYLQSGENEIVVRVGAARESVPKKFPSGWDYEKLRYSPGIFDSVELVLTGAPYIERVQTVPDLKKKAVTVLAWVRNDGTKSGATKLDFAVREVSTGKVVGSRQYTTTMHPGSSGYTANVTIPLSSCNLWSPEHPFLYELETRTPADDLKTRFGMRTFSLDPRTGRAMLNGRPYFMRGSNVTLYRFFEDAECGGKPWDEDWVRRLHQSFKTMHWNSLRYCIGFPPEFWYRIADEEGFLIQDEFPIWNMDAKAGDFDTKELANEYREWMQERWNHPCVVIWDACNETNAPETGKALAMVRDLDLSNRPWDNGWAKPVAAGDSRELHPYHFQDPKFTLDKMTKDPGTLEWKPGKNPIIVNEYGWLWLNRDGTPTALTRDLYKNLLGAKSTTDQRRELYARYTAAETEFWRAHRSCAGVLHFCALGYSRPGDKKSPESGATSDHWLDVEKLVWEPQFYKYVRDSFAPVGVMVDAWAKNYRAGSQQTFPVYVTNDLDRNWNGKVRCRLLKDGREVSSKTQACVVAPWGKKILQFTTRLPGEAGAYRLEAALVGGAEEVVSLRDFKLVTPRRSLARQD